MSIPFNGTRTTSRGVISAIIKHLKSITLKPLKSIDVQFDPFHKNGLEARDFLFHISSPKVVATNPRCLIKPQVLSDNSGPVVTFNLLSGDRVMCKAENLSTLNILELYNKHITPLAPLETDTDTLSGKPLAEKKKKKRRTKIKPGSKHRGVFL